MTVAFQHDDLDQPAGIGEAVDMLVDPHHAAVVVLHDLVLPDDLRCPAPDVEQDGWKYFSWFGWI